MYPEPGRANRLARGERAIITRVFAVLLLVLAGVIVVASVWYGLRISTRARSNDNEPPYAPPPVL